MSDTNRVALGFDEETVVGTTNATPDFTQLRMTGTPNMGGVPVTVISNEIQSDRQVSDLILVGKEAGGDVGIELSFDVLGVLIEGALYSDWSYKPTIVNTAADTEITDVETVLDTFTVASGGGAFVADMLVRTTNFTNSANNTLFIVASSTATTVVTDTVPALVAEIAPPIDARLRAVGFSGPANDIDAEVSPNRLLSAGGVDFTTMGLSLGEWLKIGGSATLNKYLTAANNDWVRISKTVAITATTITLDIVPSGWAQDVVAAGEVIYIWFGDRITNGTTEKSYSLERRFLDLATPEFEVFTGMHIDTLSLTFDAAAVVEGSLSMIGWNQSFSTSEIAGATRPAVGTSGILNTSSNVGSITENGTVISGSNLVLNAGITTNNNLRRQRAVGTLGDIGTGAGEFSVTGNLNSYFDDSTQVAKVIANTSSQFSIVTQSTDTINQAVLFDLPTIKFSSGIPEVAGKNDDVVANLEFQAIKDADLGYTILAQQFWEVV